MMDGKGITKYLDDAATIIKEAMNKDMWECVTDYFEFKWFKNGNMHVTFRRLDLVYELNRIYGDNRITLQ